MSKRWARALTALVNGVTWPQRPWRRAHTHLLVAAALHETSRVETRHGPLVFVSTHVNALQYPRYHMTREPETTRWIDGFETPCVFWDIGAMVGEFTLYAAQRPGVSVVAFEPAAANYAALCRNIEVNRRGGQVQAFCVALGDRTRSGQLNLSSSDAASHFNSFDSTENCFGQPLDIVFSQSAVGFAADEFRRIFGLPAPNYLKLDVDGTEERILAGAAATLADPALRSVLVEIEEEETPRSRPIIERLERAGFMLSERGVSQHGVGEPAVSNAIFVRPAAQ
jgi:FkbM family methyltransferase